MNFLRNKEVEFIIAPYEADSQLAYLQLKSIIDTVATDDGDLLIYGASIVGDM